MLFFLIQSNFSGLLVIIFFCVFLFTSTTLEKKLRTLFITVTLLLMGLIVADIFDYWFASFNSPNFMRYVFSSAGYIIRPLMILSVIMISGIYTKKQRIFMSVLWIANAIISVLSMFLPIMYYYDENNIFHRLPMGYFTFIVSGIYMIIITGVAVKKTMIGMADESVVLFIAVLIMLLGTFMEMAMNFKFILDGMAASATAFYYTFLHTRTYTRDPMTLTLNRRSFYSDVKRLSSKSMTIVSADLNNLKQINDNMGHEAGDKAISTVAGILSETFVRFGRVYRTGGDEFIILCPDMKKENTEEKLADAAAKIAESGYEIAYGTSFYTPEMDFDASYTEADNNMYENKRSMKTTPVR